MFDPDNPVTRHCIAGMEAEGRGDPAAARAAFQSAWDASQDDFDRCVAAHYVARHQPDAEGTRRWNEAALRHADALGDDPRVGGLLPSLCLNLGHSLLLAGRGAEAAALFQRGHAALGSVPAGPYYDLVAGGLARALARVGTNTGGPA